MNIQDLMCGNTVMYKWFNKYIEYPPFGDGKPRLRTEIIREHLEIMGIDQINQRVLIKPSESRRNYKWVSIDAVKPIELTEQMLIDYGFIDITSYKDYELKYPAEHDDLSIKFSVKKGIVTFPSIEELGLMFNRDEKVYLHYLQNLHQVIFRRILINLKGANDRNKK